MIHDFRKGSFDEHMDLRERYENSRHFMEEHNMHHDYKLNFKHMKGVPKKCQGKDVCYNMERCMYCVPFWEDAVEKVEQCKTSTTGSNNYISVELYDEES